jgi:hypothetical protein
MKENKTYDSYTGPRKKTRPKIPTPDQEKNKT